MTRLEVQTEHLELRRLRPWLDSSASDLEPSLIGRVELCIHELATNVVDHSGAATFSLEMTRSPQRITVLLRDRGVPFDLAGVPDLEPHPRVRGYGMMIAEHLATDLTYERHGDTNLWRVEFEH